MRPSRGATEGTLHWMVNDLPTATKVGHNFSSTCFGGSEGKKEARSGQDGGAVPAGSTHPGPSPSPQCSQEVGWGLAALKCKKRKEEAVQGEGYTGWLFYGHEFWNGQEWR